MDPYLAASWKDDDLQPLRDWRRMMAKRIQDTDASKEDRRDAQKCEKAATLVLDCILGAGRCKVRVPADYFPAELRFHVSRATARLGVCHGL